MSADSAGGGGDVIKEELCFNWQNADWRVGGESSPVSAEAECYHISKRLYLMLYEQVIEESLICIRFHAMHLGYSC